MGRIVVGIDGSEQSLAALRWAIEEARLRSSTVEAVHVYEPPSAPGTYGYETVAVVSDMMEQMAQAARQEARRLVDEVVGRADTDEVAVEIVTIEELGAAQTLVQQAQDAELLVVGSRGRGGFKGLLLGSVSNEAANHAPCPVVILRH